MDNRDSTLISQEADEISINSELEADRGNWGQPPIGLFVLKTMGQTFTGYEIKGFYACSSYPTQRYEVDPQLRSELETWETASSEALDLIERSLP